MSQWAQIDVRTVGRDRATNLRVAQELGSSPIGMRCRAHVAQGSDMAPWWTRGFEAYGELDEVEPVLSRTVLLMARRRPPPLNPGEAIGYPSWLMSRRW